MAGKVVIAPPPDVLVGAIVLDAAGKRYRVEAPGVFEAVERVTFPGSDDPRVSGREYIHKVYATGTGCFQAQPNGLPAGWTVEATDATRLVL